MEQRYTRVELLQVGVELLAEIHEMQGRLEWMEHPDDIASTRAKLAGLQGQLRYVEEYLENLRRTPKKRKRKKR